MSLSHLCNTPISSSITSKNPLPSASTKISTPSVRLANPTATHYISCEHNKQTSRREAATNVTQHVVDRRNVLLGLGGLYGAAGVAIGAPLTPPDLTKCHKAIDSDATPPEVDCCPPDYGKAKMVDFTPPSPKDPLRVRKAAHKYNLDDIAKFEAAIAKMKALPTNHPWNYYQQATIHCTYCNGAFDQLNTKTLLQVHGSWFFLPWHRYYLYFWEKILGKLIGDDTFAIPFWNWDAPKGMYMPPMYLNEKSPLFDKTRDKRHYKSVLDYSYSMGADNPPDPKPVVTNNLEMLSSMFKETSNAPALFMGKPLRAGEDPTSTTAPGSCEMLHNVMHQWVGPPTSPYWNMGNFHTAARDTIFFAHHGNVDRMWDIYNNSRGQRREFNDPDWLDSSFIFYDENEQLVNCKVRDCLTPQSLGYIYHPEPIPWTNNRRKHKKMRSAAKKKSEGDSLKLAPVPEFGSQPRPLTEPIRALLQRPKISRTKDEKADAVEVLVIDGITVPNGSTARFDVYVTQALEGLVGPDRGELAGSFVHIPTAHHRSSEGKEYSSLELGISILLEDIEAESSKELVVSLIPRDGDVVVSGLRIELFDVEDDDEEEE
ncbi:hypothetical protein C5167_040663 [Papaver somniferum]|uniref:Tyrosinase copper-binding domain-containing protein n=1 Tax=Papaver somniferum TaxID=3469 RepID=A0A4Y7IJU3_PAPSO|nr:polyphenol oxidase, chloroplastic-like [Papaver somniferum]RZC47725.1 hypothetical protein C5167_040663 [Papaver somniferum]